VYGQHLPAPRAQLAEDHVPEFLPAARSPGQGQALPGQERLDLVQVVAVSIHLGAPLISKPVCVFITLLSGENSSIDPELECNQSKKIYLLLFRKSSKTIGGRELVRTTSALLSPVFPNFHFAPSLPAALTRNCLRAAGFLQPMPFMALLHAARGAGSDMRGPRLRRPVGRRVKRPLRAVVLKRPAGPPGAVLSEPGKWSGVTAPDTHKQKTVSRPGGHSAPASPRTAGSV